MRVGENACGQCIIATADLPANALVAVFDGPIVPSWDEVPPEEIRHAIGLHDGGWLIPITEARYLNHSCNPNCRISDDLEVITVRPVASGEELTISYTHANLDEYRARPENYVWDARWNFPCQCGSANCVGAVNKYEVVAAE